MKQRKITKSAKALVMHPAYRMRVFKNKSKYSRKNKHKQLDT